MLDVGALDGHFSVRLRDHFEKVAALDLRPPEFDYVGISKLAGDITALPLAAQSFDTVFCVEVLEHVRNVELACNELQRVTAHDLIIGVPYRQDIRLGRTNCRDCGRINPPWGHVNAFDLPKLDRLFSQLKRTRTSYVGVSRWRTSALAMRLMDLGGNPWGTYNQESVCIYCGGNLDAPDGRRSLAKRLCSAAAASLNRIHSELTRPHPNWVHALYQRA